MPFKTKEEKQKYMKKYREEKLEENPDLYKKEYNKRKNTEVYKENKRKREKKYYQNNKEKSRAKELASKIPLKEICEVCKENPARYRHHPDYSKPLEVIHVCVECHKKIHNGSGDSLSLFEYEDKDLDMKFYPKDKVKEFIRLVLIDCSELFESNELETVEFVIKKRAGDALV